MADWHAVARAEERVRILKAAYADAVARVEVACEELRNVAMPHPDGQQNYRNALSAERVALELYTTAVQHLAVLTRPDYPGKSEP